MDGGDGRRVESGERIGQAFTALREFFGGAGEQVPQHLVLTDQVGVVEGGDGVGDLPAHPVPQFLGGGPAEGDEQHLIQRRHTLGDVPSHQRGQREGLPRSGTGFQHRGRTRRGQRAHQIEATRTDRRLHHQCAPLIASSSGRHTRTE